MKLEINMANAKWNIISAGGVNLACLPHEQFTMNGDDLQVIGFYRSCGIIGRNEN